MLALPFTPQRPPSQLMRRTAQTRIKQIFIVCGILGILTLLAEGQLAATILLMVPLVFLIFGRRQ